MNIIAYELRLSVPTLLRVKQSKSQLSNTRWKQCHSPTLQEIFVCYYMYEDMNMQKHHRIACSENSLSRKTEKNTVLRCSVE